MRRRLLLSPILAAAFAGVMAPPPVALAQGATGAGAPWPTRPIRVVVPFAPGTQADIIPRLLAPALAAALGQPIVVENRPGAGGTLGADAVAKSAPDGHTLGLSNIQPQAVAPAVYASVPYDPVRDFAHVAMLAEMPLVLAVAAAGPAQDLGQFAALARRTLGGPRVGTNGNGSSAHVSTEVYRRLAGIELTHVPYRGSSAAAITDIAGGRIDAVMTSLGEVGHNERLRILAIAAPERLAGWPGVPTFREAGYPDMVVSVWFGLSGPAGLPDGIADRLHRVIRLAVARPEVAARLADMGAGPDRGLSRAEFAAFVVREVARWSEVARTAGVRAE